MNNPVHKHSKNINKPKTHRDRKNDYKRKDRNNRNGSDANSDHFSFKASYSSGLPPILQQI